MSVIKGVQQHRTVLDFSKGKVSKNLVKQALRRAEILEMVSSQNTTVFIENSIQVGMYSIVLRFPYEGVYPDKSRLKDYGKFGVTIHEVGSNCAINLSKDKRFKNQYWVSPNKDFNLLMKNLTDIVVYCSRLDKMKMFL